MPLKQLGPFFDYYINAYSPSALASTGAVMEVPVPFRGRVMEVGVCPVANSCTSALTLQVVIGDNTSAIASSFSATPIVTSGTGTFSSVNLVEGAVCSVLLGGSQFVNRGDVLQFTTSGGQSAAMGAQVYAIIRKQ